MAALTYKTLIGSQQTEDSIKNWANSSSIPATAMIRDAELWIQERLRVREMLVTDAGTLAADAETILFSALTSAATRLFRMPYFFMFTGTERSFPAYKTLDFVLGNRTWNATGVRTKARPSYWALDAAAIRFETQALDAAGYPYSFTYYGDLASLAPGNQTNALTSKYPRLLRLAIMMFANEWKKDDQEKIYYRGLAEDEITNVNANRDLELMGVDLQMMVDGDGGVSGGLQGYGNL